MWRLWELGCFGMESFLLIPFPLTYLACIIRGKKRDRTAIPAIPDLDRQADSQILRIGVISASPPLKACPNEKRPELRKEVKEMAIYSVYTSSSWEIPLSLIYRHFPALSGISLPDHFKIRQYTPGSTGVMESS